jgi:hypothetical protein
LLLAGARALALCRTDEFGDWADYKITKQRASEAAETFLRSRGFDLSGTRRAVAAFDRTDATAAGVSAAQRRARRPSKSVYRDKVDTPLWPRRATTSPRSRRSYGVSVDPVGGACSDSRGRLPD